MGSMAGMERWSYNWGQRNFFFSFLVLVKEGILRSGGACSVYACNRLVEGWYRRGTHGDDRQEGRKRDEGEWGREGGRGGRKGRGMGWDGMGDRTDNGQEGKRKREKKEKRRRRERARASLWQPMDWLGRQVEGVGFSHLANQPRAGGAGCASPLRVRPSFLSFFCLPALPAGTPTGAPLSVCLSLSLCLSLARLPACLYC